MIPTSFASDHLIILNLAEHGKKAIEAAQQTEDHLVRQHVDAMRHLRAMLKRKSFNSTEQNSSLILASTDHEKIRIASTQIVQAEKFIDVWSKRYLQLFPLSELFKSVNGCHAILDAFLPATWDWNSDLLVCVVGQDDHPLLQALHEREQKRVMIIMDGHSPWNRQLPGQWQTFQADDALKFSKWLSPPIEQACAIDSLETVSSANLLKLVRAGIMSHQSNVNTFKMFGQRWLEQGLLNLPNIAQHPAWSSLNDVANGLPAVIVSPGPSLQQNLHQLRDVQERVLIIATAQAILAMQTAGITPHIIVVSDPQDMSHYFEGYIFHEKTVLSIGRTCAPALFKLPAHHFITHPVSSVTDGWINKILQDDQFFHAGGSVAITAFSMALKWSCRSIALIGQDLSLRNGQQYAVNTADSDLNWIINEQENTAIPTNTQKAISQLSQKAGATQEMHEAKMQLLQLPGYYEGKVLTKPDYFLFHGQFEEIARELKKSGTEYTRIYNCTEGGAHIAGFHHISLQDWLLKETVDQPIIEWVQEINNVKNSHDKKGSFSAKISKWKAETLKSMNKGLAAAAACKTLFSTERTYQFSQKLNSEEGILLQQLEKLEFISIAHQQAIFDALATIKLADNLDSALQAESDLITLIERIFLELIPKILNNEECI